MKIEDLMKTLEDIHTPSTGFQKTASAPTGVDSMVKVAEELKAGGTIFGEAAADRIMAIVGPALEKIAAAKAGGSSSHATAEGGLTGKWAAVAKKLKALHAAQITNSDQGHTRAEDVIPGVAREVKG